MAPSYPRRPRHPDDQLQSYYNSLRGPWPDPRKGGGGQNPMDIYGLLGVGNDDAMTMGLLSASNALLSAGAGGPTPAHASLGAGLGRAGLGGLAAFKAQKKANLEDAVSGLKVKSMISSQKVAEDNAALAKKLGIPVSALPGYFAGKYKKQFAIPKWKSVKMTDGSVVMFNENDPSDRKSIPSTGGMTSKDKNASEKGMREFYTKGSGEFLKVRDAFARVRVSVEKPSAAGDLSLIFNYMKMLDPGSTVREGEFANAQNAAGVPDRVRAFYGNMMRGTRMTDDQRSDFYSRSEGLFAAQKASHDKLTKEVTRIAEGAGLRPKQVIVDYGLADHKPYSGPTVFNQPNAELTRLKELVDANPGKYTRGYKAALDAEIDRRYEQQEKDE